MKWEGSGLFEGGVWCQERLYVGGWMGKVDRSIECTDTRASRADTEEGGPPQRLTVRTAWVRTAQLFHLPKAAAAPGSTAKSPNAARGGGMKEKTTTERVSSVRNSRLQTANGKERKGGEKFVLRCQRSSEFEEHLGTLLRAICCCKGNPRNRQLQTSNSSTCIASHFMEAAQDG